MQAVGMKAKLEEKIRALEEEKRMLLEEVKQLKEVVELNERAKVLEDDVGRLRDEVRALKQKIPERLLRGEGWFASRVMEESADEDECAGCDEEELV